MAKERSIKDAWQAARANATNRVAVRDCLTQTPRPADQELASQEEENASNHQRDSEMVPVEDESLLNSSDTTQLLTTSASPAHGGDPENARNHQRDSVDEPLLNGTDTTQLLTTSASPAPRGDPEGDPKAPDDKNAKIVKKVAIYAAVFGATAAVIGVGAFIAVPLALAGAGFTAAGIASGSIGASMMSASAIASGGGVAAGSVVAVLQSAGAAGGIGAATCAALGIGTAAVGTALVAAVDVTVGQVRYIKRQGHRNPNVDAGTQTDDDDKKDTDTKNDDDNEKDTDKQMDTDEQTVTDKQANADAPTEE